MGQERREEVEVPLLMWRSVHEAYQPNQEYNGQISIMIFCMLVFHKFR